MQWFHFSLAQKIDVSWVSSYYKISLHTIKIESFWDYFVVPCYPLLSLAVPCCPLLSLAVSCCPLLSLVVPRCPSLSFVLCCPLLSYIYYCGYNFFYSIATVKAEATTRTGIQHTQTPSSQPLTWQHDIKSLPHREQIDGSTVC